MNLKRELSIDVVHEQLRGTIYEQSISPVDDTMAEDLIVREGTFFLGGGGRAGEFWYFFQKKVLALPHVLIKKLLTPHF